MTERVVPTSQRGTSKARFAYAAVAVFGLSAIGLAVGLTWAGKPVTAQERTSKGQELLPVEWGNADVKAAMPRGGARSFRDSVAGIDSSKLDGLQIPVVGFSETPKLVRNVLGKDAKPTKPRAFISDAKTPYWYQLVDTYDGISIGIEADRRVNQSQVRDFGTKRSLSADGPARVSIQDGSTEQGLDGVLISYTVARYPDIPYTVTIECTGAKKAQCKDIATIQKDQSLLKVIAARGS